jgi:uncharacterized LabA/DUF88 family protein
MNNQQQTKKGNYAFIDSQNVNLSIRSQGWRIDWIKFREFLKTHYNVERAYMFIGFMADNQELYTSLQQAGFIILFKPLVEQNDDVAVKGNTDAELVLHAMIELPNYEKAVIVSGDGDFYSLVEYLQKKGKLAKLLIPNERKYSSLLKKIDDSNIAFLSDMRGKLNYGNRTTANRHQTRPRNPRNT